MARLWKYNLLRCHLLFDNNHVELTILASTMALVASVPQNFTVTDDTEAHPVKLIDESFVVYEKKASGRNKRKKNYKSIC